MEKHVLDVDVLALVGAAALITADDDDGGNVEARGGHQLARRRLVARGEAHHAVELRALDLNLDVVGDQIARRQNVGAGAAGAVDEVARRGGANFERQAARGAHAFLDHLRDAVEMAEADRELRGGVDDCNLRLRHVLVGEAQRTPLRAAHRPERRADLVIAAKFSRHRPSRPPARPRRIASSPRNRPHGRAFGDRFVVVDVDMSRHGCQFCRKRQRKLGGTGRRDDE
jgi:hypothetical protein